MESTLFKQANQLAIDAPRSTEYNPLYMSVCRPDGRGLVQQTFIRHAAHNG